MGRSGSWGGDGRPGSRPAPRPAPSVLSPQMASMKMFQVQFHTGFVPRNATTVKFAKCVGVPRGGQ